MIVDTTMSINTDEVFDSLTLQQQENIVGDYFDRLTDKAKENIVDWILNNYGYLFD